MGAGVVFAADEAMRTGCEGSCLGSAERMRRRCERAAQVSACGEGAFLHWWPLAAVASPGVTCDEVRGMFCAREPARCIPTPGGVIGSARAAPGAGSARSPRGESGITGESRQGLAFLMQVFHGGVWSPQGRSAPPGAP